MLRAIALQSSTQRSSWTSSRRAPTSSLNPLCSSVVCQPRHGYRGICWRMCAAVISGRRGRLATLRAGWSPLSVRCMAAPYVGKSWITLPAMCDYQRVGLYTHQYLQFALFPLPDELHQLLRLIHLSTCPSPTRPRSNRNSVASRLANEASFETVSNPSLIANPRRVETVAGWHDSNSATSRTGR